MILSRFKKQIIAAAAMLGLWCLISCSNASKMNESTANVRHITQTEFTTQVAQSTNAVVADFYATWCGPCRMLSPMLDRLATPLTGEIKFVKINVDESPALAKQFQVEGIPTLIFFKNGKETDRVTGLMPEADLKTKLEAFANVK